MMMLRKNLLGLMIYLGLLSELYAQASLAAVSPARFELNSSPGQRVAQVLDIYNPSSKTASYSIRSSEWFYDDFGRSSYSDDLKEGSCRPWLKLERRKVTIAPQQRRRFRFEFHIPEDVAHQECRLALFIESDERAEVAPSGGMNLPVKGRIAVIVYLGVGDVSPKLQVQGVRRLQDGSYAIVTMNKGTATGRLASELRAVDVDGKDYDAGVSSSPVLPGQRRLLPLNFVEPMTPVMKRNGRKPQAVMPNFPVQLSGRIYAGGTVVPVKVRLSGGK